MRRFAVMVPDARPIRILRWLVWLVPVVGFCLTLVAGWPGGISPDAKRSILEGLSFSFTGQQPPLLALAWSPWLALFPLRVAIGVAFVLQALAYWLAFGLFAYAALREGSLLVAIVASLAGFLPPLFDFVVMVESNVHNGIAWTLAIALALAFRSRRILIVCVPLVFYGSIARSGTIVAVAPILFACVVLALSPIPHRKAALYSLAATCAFFLVSITVTAIFLGSVTRARAVSIVQLYDIAGIYQKTGTECLPPSLVPKTNSAKAILADFDPSLVGTITWDNKKGGFIPPKSASDLANLRACWIRTILRHPLEYLWVRARFARLFLMIGVEWAPATVPDYSANARFGLSVPHNALPAAIHDYVEYTRQSVIWKGWFWFLLTGVACGLALVRGTTRAHAALGIYLAALGSLIPHLVFGQAALSRYYFPLYMLCLACLLVIAVPLLRSARTW